jgi:amino acid adenylation domain-containing protein
MELRAFLHDLRSRDIKIWLEGQCVKVNAPAGTLTPELRREVARRKPDIIALLTLAENAAAGSDEARDGTFAEPIKISSSTGQLSFGQERLWFVDQLDHSSAVYNVPMPTRLRGRLDLEALHSSLDALVARHAALRSTFRTVDGAPVQVIEEPRPLALAVVDLSSQLPAEREATMAQVLGTESRRPFDLSTGPLLRAVLVRLGDLDQVLMITMHHIVCDGWSMGVLMRDLSEMYDARTAGRVPSLPELPIQYTDYAAWQRERIVGDELERHVGYWREQLRGAPFLLELPADRARPPIASGRGDCVRFQLPPHLVKGLKDVSRAHGATLFMTLLAGYGALLGRYTGQADLLVGSPVAGRTRTEFEDLVGLFVNTLVYRVDSSGDPGFSELLRRVREMALDANAHQELPFEKLVELLQPHRSLAHHPLVQVMFVFHNMQQHAVGPADLASSSIDLQTGTAKIDLNLTVMEDQGGLEAWLEYDSDLFDRVTIERLAEHYDVLLTGIVANAEAHISELPLLGEAERQQLVGDWNATEAEYPTEAGVHHLIEEQAAREPNAVAVVFEDRSLTYAELNRRANQVARHLQDLGVGSETIVGVYLERSLDMVVALLGILKAGGTYLPLDPLFPAERLAYMLEDSQAAVVVTQHSLVGTIATGQATVVRLDADWPLIAERADEDLPWQTTAERLAYILYTSGSTGRPKGVQVLHSSLVNFLESMRERPGLAADDVLLSVTTLSFDIAGLELFLPLTTGARVVLVSSAVAADGGALLEALQRSGATVMQATPATWRLLLAAGWERMPRLRALCGGEAVSAELAAQIVARTGAMWNMYGPTETTIWSTVHPISASATGASVPIGRPIANTSVYVLDGRLEPVPVGVPGELYIGGAGVARGYLNLPELTAERFVADPFRPETGGRMYRTGDLVRWRADGNLDYLERVDTQVKIRGYRIELGEIETLLEQDASVRQAVVIVREDVPGDKRLVGYVVPTAAAGVSVQALKDQLRKTLPAYMVPTLLVTLDHLPLTPNGKVDRKALPSTAETQPERTRQIVIPRTEVERQIAAMWQDVLKLEAVGVTDNFFDLGGHSLLILQVHSRIRQTFETELSVAQMFQYPTVEALAQHVHHAQGGSASVNQAHDRGQRLRVELDRLRRAAAERRVQP